MADGTVTVQTSQPSAGYLNSISRRQLFLHFAEMGGETGAVVVPQQLPGD